MGNPTVKLQNPHMEVGWRGCFKYFDIKTGELAVDDAGCYLLNQGGATKAMHSLIETYETLKDDINPNGFIVGVYEPRK